MIAPAIDPLVGTNSISGMKRPIDIMTRMGSAMSGGTDKQEQTRFRQAFDEADRAASQPTECGSAGRSDEIRRRVFLRKPGSQATAAPVTASAR